MQTQLKVSGMSCQMCVGHVTRALQNVDGVQNVEVDLDSGLARVQHEESANAAQMIEAVIEDGYEAQLAAA